MAKWKEGKSLARFALLKKKKPREFFLSVGFEATKMVSI
jgi:hypothetical protein